MKITVIKGPLFKESKIRAQKLIFEILKREIDKEQNKNTGDS